MASAAEVATPDKWQSMMRLIKANRQSYLTGTQLASSASGTNVRVPMLTPPMLAELVGALGVNEHWSALDIFKQKFHVLMDVNGEVTPVYTYLPNMTLAIGPWRIEIDAFADGMFGVQSAPTSGGAGVLESDGRDAASRKRGRDASAADTPTPAVTHAHKTRTATGAPAGQLSARSAGVEADADDDEEGEGDHPCTRKLEDGSACDKSYMSRRALWAHIRNKHEGLMFKCNYHGCGREYTTAGTLGHHVKSAHGLGRQEAEDRGLVSRVVNLPSSSDHGAPAASPPAGASARTAAARATFASDSSKAAVAAQSAESGRGKAQQAGQLESKDKGPRYEPDFSRLEDDGTHPICTLCGDGGDLLLCDNEGCRHVYHLVCLKDWQMPYPRTKRASFICAVCSKAPLPEGSAFEIWKLKQERTAKGLPTADIDAMVDARRAERDEEDAENGGDDDMDAEDGDGQGGKGNKHVAGMHKCSWAGCDKVFAYTSNLLRHIRTAHHGQSRSSRRTSGGAGGAAAAPASSPRAAAADAGADAAASGGAPAVSASSLGVVAPLADPFTTSSSTTASAAGAPVIMLQRYTCTFEGCELEFASTSERDMHSQCHQYVDGVSGAGGVAGSSSSSPAASSGAGVGDGSGSAPSSSPADPSLRAGHFPCLHDNCGKVFHHRDNLSAHIKSVHSGYRYHCLVDGCGREFTQPGSRNRHMRDWHRMEAPAGVSSGDAGALQLESGDASAKAARPPSSSAVAASTPAGIDAFSSVLGNA